MRFALPIAVAPPNGASGQSYAATIGAIERFPENGNPRILPMADSSSGGGNALAFIVGGLVVVVAIIAVLVFTGGGGMFGGTKKVDVDISAPALPSAPDPAK